MSANVDRIRVRIRIAEAGRWLAEEWSWHVHDSAQAHGRPSPCPAGRGARGGGGAAGRMRGERRVEGLRDHQDRRLLRGRARQRHLPENPRGVRRQGGRHHRAGEPQRHRPDPEGPPDELLQVPARPAHAGQPGPSADRRHGRAGPAVGLRHRRRRVHRGLRQRGDLQGLALRYRAVREYHRPLLRPGQALRGRRGTSSRPPRRPSPAETPTASPSAPRPPTRAPGSSCPSSGPTARRRPISPHPPRPGPFSCGWTWSTRGRPPPAS